MASHPTTTTKKPIHKIRATHTKTYDYFVRGNTPEEARANFETIGPINADLVWEGPYFDITYQGPADEYKDQ